MHSDSVLVTSTVITDPERDEQKWSAFALDLERLINRHSMEQFSNTPDFLLASYLVSCMRAYGYAVTQRDRLRA